MAGDDRATSAESLTATLERMAAERGLRLSEKQRAVLKVLADMPGEFSPDDVYIRAGGSGRGFGRSTIYKVVRLLWENGLLARTWGVYGQSRYSVEPMSRRQHLVDVATRRTVDLDDAELQALCSDLARRFGYQLVGWRVELYGRRSQGDPADGAA